MFGDSFIGFLPFAPLGRLPYDHKLADGKHLSQIVGRGRLRQRHLSRIAQTASRSASEMPRKIWQDVLVGLQTKTATFDKYIIVAERSRRLRRPVAVDREDP